MWCVLEVCLDQALDVAAAVAAAGARTAAVAAAETAACGVLSVGLLGPLRDVKAVARAACAACAAADTVVPAREAHAGAEGHVAVGAARASRHRLTALRMVTASYKQVPGISMNSSQMHGGYALSSIVPNKVLSGYCLPAAALLAG